MWLNLCIAWNSNKQLLVPKSITYAYEYGLAPLWSPGPAHNDNRKVACKSISQRHMRDVGFLTMGDILDGNGLFLPWDKAMPGNPSRFIQNSYNNLIVNIQPLTINDEMVRKLVLIYVTDGSTSMGTRV